ncbi:MAG: ABC transporter substrate-binding protein [Actinomycetaceae bacterium]|nr:ABC transporter substrate-binding protein [Actinomycetaceae bacterium]
MQPQTRRSRWAAFAGVVAAGALVLSACGGGADSPAEGGEGAGTINVGVAYETTNYHPSNTSSALAMGTNWHVVEGLYEFDMSNYEIYDALAAGDPVEVSPTEYEITLRDGAKFSDGTDVTAEDVVTSIERSNAEGNLYASFLSFIDSVSAKDDTTVTITLKQPFTLLKERLAVVKIVPAGASDEDLTAMPIGTGPWKYESITDTDITAVPNEHYNGKFPAGAAEMHWMVQKDDTARTTAASDGTIQVMEAVPAENVDVLKNAGLTVEEVPGFNLPFLLFNTTKAPFDNPKVRQAFHMAIDRQKLVDNAMAGKAKVATSFLPESHPNYKKAETQFDYDVDAAKALLAEAGVEPGEITLLTTDHPWITNLSPQIRTDLEALGFTVNVQAEASASLYSNNLDVEGTPTFDIAVAPGDPSVFGNDPALLMSWWYGDNVWTQKRTFWQTSDKAAFDTLSAIINEATTLEGAEQQAKWDEAQDFLAEQVPLYPLFHRTMITAYDAEKLDNVKPIATTGIWLVGASTK